MQKKFRTICAILSPGTRTMCAISLAKCFSFLSSCLSHPQIFTVGRFGIHAVLYSEILHNCYRLACNSLMAKKGLHGHKKGLNQVQSLVRTCTVFFYVVPTPGSWCTHKPIPNDIAGLRNHDGRPDIGADRIRITIDNNSSRIVTNKS